MSSGRGLLQDYGVEVLGFSDVLVGERGREETFFLLPRAMVFSNVTRSGHMRTVPMLLSGRETHTAKPAGVQCVCGQKLAASVWCFPFQILTASGT